MAFEILLFLIVLESGKSNIKPLKDLVSFESLFLIRSDFLLFPHVVERLGTAMLSLF
jgi:hypothetical protein